eukprot:CAMPEP_0203665160 /NCGR_PEP_ID=MMETSP0090-20130426/2421_1 /ASSEMBLY_ACC=CAM_ASM_001088 /TAXON_ID=426623 /ORGANISM="Chaetoceros affinis, Strain CCMP159" /LENGTH=345 /DNA_ID=CAMNT_0050528625 /DNA_START=251 /DNA_END=1288 /DNA_ORIENTATION=-
MTTTTNNNTTNNNNSNAYLGGAGLLPFAAATGQQQPWTGDGRSGGRARRAYYTHFRDLLYCHCEAGDIQREIDCLKDSSECALHQAYDEVDELNEKCKVQQKEMVALSEQLKASKERVKAKERQYTDAKKKLILAANASVNAGGGHATGVASTSGSSMTRIGTKSPTLSANSLASLALKKISSHHSLSTLFSLKRPGTLTGASTSPSHTDTDTSTSIVPNPETSSSASHSSPVMNMLQTVGTVRSSSPAISDLSGRSQRPATCTGSDDSETDSNFTLNDHDHDHDHNGQKTAENEVEVENLVLRLESREREISHLRELMINNVKNIQDLQQKLETRGEYCMPLRS